MRFERKSQSKMLNKSTPNAIFKTLFFKLIFPTFSLTDGVNKFRRSKADSSVLPNPRTLSNRVNISSIHGGYISGKSQAVNTKTENLGPN